MFEGNGMQRAAGATLEHDNRFALIGDGEGRDLADPGGLAVQQRAQHGEGVLPYLLGIVLDPAGLRVVLRVLKCLAIKRTPVRIEEQGLRGGGALIQREKDAHGRSRSATSHSTRKPT
jgi:hypothetical protein